jgi:hypothetical protein
MPPDPDPLSRRQSATPRTSTLLLAFAIHHTHERVYLRDLARLLGNRSFGFLLLLFALPNTLPIIGIPGVSTLTGVPLAIVALQMMTGLPEPKLPAWVTERSLHRDDFRRIIDAIIPWLRKLERLMKPRWLGITGPAGERWLGAFCLLLAVVLVLPIPLGNLPPAVAVTLVALGLIEKDGIFVALGLVVGAGSLALVAGVVSAMVLTAVFFVREVLS